MILLITPEQDAYLRRLDEKKLNNKVSIFPYNEESSRIAKFYIDKIKCVIPKIDVRDRGSSALKISGCLDVDLIVFCQPSKQELIIKRLKKVLGDKMENPHKWNFKIENRSINIVVGNLSDKRRQDQMFVFEVLKKDKYLRYKYESLKDTKNGGCYLDYKKMKMDFFNRIIVVNNHLNIERQKLLSKTSITAIDSHVVIPGNRHSRTVFTKYKFFNQSKIVDIVARDIAKKFKDDDIDVVIGPAHGGDLLTLFVAHNLSFLKKKQILSMFIEKNQEGAFCIKDKSNSLILNNKKVLLIDDTIKTGNSFNKMKDLISSLGGRVVGLGVICNRECLRVEDLSVPKFYSFIIQDNHLYSFKAQDCPMCRDKIKFSKEFEV